MSHVCSPSTSANRSTLSGLAPSSARRSSSSRWRARSPSARSASTATRWPTPSTTVASTRPCTRSPARTSTAGASGSGARFRTVPSARTSPLEGIDVNEALVGEQWRIGTTVFELVDVRIPCSRFRQLPRSRGFRQRQLDQAVHAGGPPRPLPAVLQEGHITAGDEIEVVHKPDHDVTITMMFRAFTTQRDLLPRLLDVGDRLAPGVRAEAEAFSA